MENKILVIDIETTHVSFKKGAIVEIGATELDIKTGERTIAFDSLCREDRLTAKHRSHPYGWIFENSNLKAEDLRGAPKFDKVISDFQEVVNQYELGCTAFNSRFDFGYLEDRGLVIPKKQPCLMLESVDVCKIRNAKGYKWPKVTEYIRMFIDKDYNEAHRGGHDSYDEAGICWDLIQKGVYKLNK